MLVGGNNNRTVAHIGDRKIGRAVSTATNQNGLISIFNLSLFTFYNFCHFLLSHALVGFVVARYDLLNISGSASLKHDVVSNFWVCYFDISNLRRQTLTERLDKAARPADSGKDSAGRNSNTKYTLEVLLSGEKAAGCVCVCV